MELWSPSNVMRFCKEWGQVFWISAMRSRLARLSWKSKTKKTVAAGCVQAKEQAALPAPPTRLLPLAPQPSLHCPPTHPPLHPLTLSPA